MSNIVLGAFVGIIASILSFQIIRDIEKVSNFKVPILKRAIIYVKYSITIILVVWCMQAIICTVD